MDGMIAAVTLALTSVDPSSSAGAVVCPSGTYPDGEEREQVGSTIVVHPVCRRMPQLETDRVQADPKCPSGLLFYNGTCQAKAAIEDQLQLRTYKILNGIRATTAAINAETSAIVYTRLKGHFERIDEWIGAALLARNAAVLAPKALAIAADLGGALGEWGTCSGTPDFQVECDNLHNFERMLHETAGELAKLEHK